MYVTKSPMSCQYVLIFKEIVRYKEFALLAYFNDFSSFYIDLKSFKPFFYKNRPTGTAKLHTNRLGKFYSPTVSPVGQSNWSMLLSDQPVPPHRLVCGWLTSQTGASRLRLVCRPTGATDVQSNRFV